jgi:hypothetical protein
LEGFLPREEQLSYFLKESPPGDSGRTQKSRLIQQVSMASAAHGPGRGEIFCPFDSKNAIPETFIEQLRHMTQSGKILPKSQKGRLRIVFMNSIFHFPERESCWRLMEMLAPHGIDCCICDEKSKNLVRQINPDLLFFFWQPDRNLLPDVPSAVMVTHPVRSAWARQSDVAFYVTDDEAAIRKLTAQLKEKTRVVPTTLSTKKTEFYGGPKRRLFYASLNWDQRRGVGYVPLYRLLDETGYFDAYGPESCWEGKVKNSYRGLLANGCDELLKTAQKAGIVLVLHAPLHFNSGTPTARIFEAAAASAVIISDKHPFVQKHFGDSVLYVDQNADPTEMFRQIDGHMRWILANPKKAVELARRSHSIATEKFPLEREAEKIEACIRKVVAERAS